MALSELIVLNRRGASDATTGPLQSACGIATCLREVRVAAVPTQLQPTTQECAVTGFERHRGVDAYRFMLRLACGLESEIAGETEILGQIKQAWRAHEEEDSEAAAALRPWMQRLLQDTKEIRSEYVVGLGSATYGSLVRRLLGTEQRGPVLLLGAGQLAEAVLPYLDAATVLLWNRHGERARELLARQRGAAAQQRIQLLDATAEAELAAWKEARNVVICIPPDARGDAPRAHAWQHRGLHGLDRGRVLHLGLESATGTAWEGIDNLSTLRDLFALRDTQASQRDALLARARRACADKAQLARLDDADGSRPGSANHGWEDLAVFQSFSY
jgi:Glutamyl-tRNAGlu reductase, N-terminal domain